MPTSNAHRAVEAIWRIESARIIAGLARMVRDIGLAEEFAQDALVAALEQWPEKGIPDNPGAWLMAVAKHRAIDLIRRKAVRAGRRLELTAQEFSLLALFLRRQGEVLSRTEIAEQVWDMNFDSATNVIDVAVRRLRNKIDGPFERTLLHTVRGMGYVLELREE